MAPPGPMAPIRARDLAYLIYTSGTTGLPKAVMVEHGSLAHTLAAVQELYGFSALDRMPVLASASFDIFLFELLTPLLAGGTAVLFDLRPTLDLGLVAEELRSSTLLHAVPAVMRQLTARVLSQRVECPRLRRVFVGGDAVGGELLESMRRAFPTARLTVLYGPTEGTILASSEDGEPGSAGEARPGNGLGRPLPGVTVEVRDGLGWPVPIGVAGELWLGGPAVARGYLGRPELTAERFVPDPEGFGRRTYRTGDRARFTATGRLEFLGRVDQQVKVRGYRIEPGEVETTLLGYPGVREAVVLAKPQGEDERLVAYVVGEGRLTGGELRRFVEARLPSPMVPRHFVQLTALPLSRHGKVDRRALWQLAVEGEEGERGLPPASAAPRTPIEELVAGLFAEVLQLERVGAQDDFFERGGHSLLATQLASRLREVLGVELPLRAIFEQPTVAGLSARVEAAVRSGAGPAAPPLTAMPARDGGGLPLSFAQQRLWFIDQLEPGSALYNMPVALRVAGPLDARLLARCLGEIVRRHEALRTAFAAPAGSPVQLIHPAAPVALPVVDLSRLPRTSGRKAASPAIDLEATHPTALALAAAEAARPFDLTAAEPLLRALLLRLAVDDHFLLVTLHHIASDGWSMGILVRELTALYAAFAAGRTSPLPALPVQYADFAVWQRSWLRGEVLDEQLAYWKRRLAGAPAVLELPLDRPRPAVQTFRGAIRPFRLERGLSEAVGELCRRRGVTPFMALLAAWAVLLGRHAGQEDVLVGAPIAGRDRREIEGLIGFFVNTLVLRVDLSGNPSFAELLDRVRRMSLDAFTHQDLPFERIVEEIVVERNRAVSPLFQVLLAFQNVLPAILDMPGMQFSPLEIHTGLAKFDLTLTLQEGPAGFWGTLELNADLIDGSTAERLLARFAALLRAAAGDPALPLHNLPALLPWERQQALVEWNDSPPRLQGPRPSPAGAMAGEASAVAPRRCLHQLVEAAADRSPDAIALVAGDQQLTRHELERRANRLAHHLRSLAIGPEALVGLCATRSPAMVIAMLGILKAGGAYVPLDPAYPRERLALLLEDSGARVVLTERGLADLVPAGGARVVLLDGEAKIDAASGERRTSGATPDNLAYVIYTSGSTGRPKGVAIAHRSAAALTSWARGELSPDELSGMLAATSISFDLSVFEIFVPLTCGGTIVLADNVLALPSLTAAPAVRLLNTVPSAAGELLRAGLLPTSVETVCLAGEPLPAALAAGLYATGTVERVLNLYGPSEDTTYSTAALVPRCDQPAPAIGRPIGGRRAYVVDRHGTPAPPGVMGELWLAGDGLARGYLGRPELTAERFVPDPFGATPGERSYRTGDRVRLRPSAGLGSELEFLGRIDHQVKVRGFRIELGEIETVLGRHPGVREVVAAVREDRPGDQRLVAYVVASGDRCPEAGELRSFLAERLPEPMVPAAFVGLASLPVLPNGKMDRRALPAPLWSRAVSPTLSRTPAEELLAEIFSEVLGLPRVGVEDNFFVLGGHSLLATRMVARLRTAFGVELPLRAVFDRPTVSGLAAEIEKASRSGSGAAAPAIERVPRPAGSAGTDESDLRGVPRPAGSAGAGGRALRGMSASYRLPLSFAQERLWFLQQLEPGSAAYNIPLELELSGALRAGALVAALSAVVRRHESLRTTFVPIAGTLSQRISPSAPAPAQIALPLVDLAGLSQAAGRSAAQELAKRHASQGFDLERGPLHAFLLVRLDGERHRFLVNLHHAIADGWSMGVLARELGELYAADVEGRPDRLPELPIQYADFAHWQRLWLAANQEKELAYWESRLGGEVASAELPTDRPRPAYQTFRGGRRQLVLPEDLTAQLKRFGRAESVTLFMTLLAAMQALISRHSGEHDVAVGVPVAGRQWTEMEGLIGCFLNTLVLRTDTSGRPSFRALAARVRSVTLEAYSHQSVPFEAVLARLGVRRDLSRSPLFQVMFNLLNLPAAELSLPGLELRGLTSAELPSKLDMTFYISEGDASIGINLVYNADLFEEGHMAEVLAQLEALLRQAVDRPDEPVAHLSLVTAWAQALLPDPASELREPAYPAVARLFLEREAAQPELVAVCFADETWSFSQLGNRAREIAGAAMAAGCGAGAVVAVAGPRSPELIASVLGVFLSGGVLLTLDRALPAARLRLMIEQAKPGCLLYVGPAHPGDGWLWELDALTIVPVERGSSAASSEPLPARPAAALPEPRPDDPAYIFFTSGTTGRPKAVLGRQKGLSHFLAWQRATSGVGPGDRVAQLTGLSFDPLLRDVFLPLTSGATLCVPDEDEMSPERILPWLTERAVTLLHTVPSLAGAWLGGAAPRFSSDALRWTFFAGEPLLDQIVGRWRAAFPRTEVINLYGPTETTMTKCFYRVPDPPAMHVQPAGVPMPETQALVLGDIAAPARQGSSGHHLPHGVADASDASDASDGSDASDNAVLCGIGEIGEIVLRTPFRSLGYLDNPLENRLRFRPNPFRHVREAAEDLLYFTGDRGRYRCDGTLEILGRLDQQVKVRGVRIEPAEIRACLGRHQTVSESAVVLREMQTGSPGKPINPGDPGDPGNQRLVAYVVLRPGAAWDPEALRRHLRLELPEVMIPGAFVALEALPLTPNGKLDSRALPSPAGSSAGEQRALLTPVEEITAGLFAELLGLVHVGPDDNFFDLGGHSLVGARLISRLRLALDVDLPLRVLFEAPTVAGLAAEIELRRRRAGAPERATISSFRRERGSPPPLSFAQERYWSGRHLEARSVASTKPTLIHLAGPLDLGCLGQALAAVVERHELLRTTFREGPAGPFQVIHAAVSMPLPIVDLERLGAPERMAEIRQWSIRDGRRHFDYERPPLFRMTLFRCAPEEHLLLFTIHHVASDGWSIFFLLNEISAFYSAFRHGIPCPLRPLAAQFQDFARWQRTISSEEALAGQVTFWRDHLHGAMPVDLGIGRPRPSKRTFAAGSLEFAVPEELEKQLESFCAQQGVTLFMTLLTAFKALLHAETGSDDLVVPCSFANRNHIETENLIGNFATALPLRTRFAGARTFRERLQRVRDVTLLAHDHPDIFWEPVVQGMSFLEEGDRGGLTTFRILFELLKIPAVEEADSNLRVSRLPVNTGKIRLDLSLFFTHSDRLTGRFRYNRDVLDEARVIHMRDRFVRILAAAVADPECPLAELPLAEAVPREVVVG